MLASIHSDKGICGGETRAENARRRRPASSVIGLTPATQSPTKEGLNGKRKCSQAGTKGSQRISSTRFSKCATDWLKDCGVRITSNVRKSGYWRRRCPEPKNSSNKRQGAPNPFHVSLPISASTVRHSFSRRRTCSGVSPICEPTRRGIRMTPARTVRKMPIHSRSTSPASRSLPALIAVLCSTLSAIAFASRARSFIGASPAFLPVACSRRYLQ